MSIKTKMILSALAAATVFYPIEEIYLPRVLNAATAHVQEGIQSTGIPSKLEDLTTKLNNQLGMVGDGIADMVTPESSKRVMKGQTRIAIIGKPGDYPTLWDVYSKAKGPHDTEALSTFYDVVRSDSRNARAMLRLTDKNGMIDLDKIGNRTGMPDTLYAPYKW
jgi:hypothetical protein